MNVKRWVTAALLAFVAVSLALAAADVAGLRSPPAPTVVGNEGAAVHGSGERVIAYYFHASTRCKTCRTIEAYAQEAVAGQQGVEWRVLNYELPQHQHFTTDYELVAPSVVLVQARDGRPGRWKNLEDVWVLVEDRPAFLAYVRKGLRDFQRGE